MVAEDYIVKYNPVNDEVIINNPQTIRGQILQKALSLTEGDRNSTYGDPLVNLTTFTQLVETYINGIPDNSVKLDATDGAIIMAMAKVSRVAVNKNHKDNYDDGTAYFAIAGECAQRLAEKDKEVF